ncbi:MAG: hypothetical protein ACFFB2_02630 [Promethearchaeota archaeon]
MKKVQFLKMNVTFNLVFVFSFLIFPTVVHATTNQKLPVIEIEDICETCTPRFYKGWDYYIIEPGTYYPYVEYLGVSGAAYYTEVGSYGFSEYSTNLAQNENMGYFLRSDDYQSTYNPFLDAEVYPRAVRTESRNEADYQIKQKTPFNVHIDYSFTFLAEANTPYKGQINYTDPFFLDIELRDEDAFGWVVLTQSEPSMYYLNYQSMTYPVFPQNETITQSFEITLSETSLVTVTPHRMKLPSSLPTIELNTSYTGEISQGGIFNLDTDTDFISYEENNIFSLRIFSLPIEEGKSYKLYLNTIDHLGSIGGLPPSDLLFYFIEDYVQIHSGSLDQNGLLISTSKSGDISLVIHAIGIMNLEYTLYFTEISKEAETTDGIRFNEDISLDEDQFYNFTIITPSIFAINWTDDYSLSFYLQDSITGNLQYLTNDNYFNPEYGWLYGESLGDLGTNWRYIPAGNYSVFVRYKGNSEAMIRFNVISINEASDSETVIINTNSLVAFEPQIMRNQYNRINLSTSDRIHQAILYEYSIIGKYGEGIYPTSSWIQIGHYETGGLLYPWDYDDVGIYSDLTTLKSEVPIVIVRPYQAYDNTNTMTVNYSATLTLTSSVTADHHPFISGDYIGDGYFIPQIGISGTSSIALGDQDPFGYQILGIPLLLEPYRLYNISVHLTGDAVFIDQLYVHGGNLPSLLVFDEYERKHTVNGTIDEFFILTVSSMSYLYINIYKESVNVNLRISIESLPSSIMYFESLEMKNYPWTTERHEGEMSNKEFAATQIIPPEMKGAAPAFEFLITLTAMIICVDFIRKRQKK